MKITGKITALLSVALMCIAVLITDVRVVALDKEFYHGQHRQLNTAEYMGMNEEDLQKMMDVLLDYLKGERSDISVQVEVNGTQRPAYDERETEHMVDVLALLRNALAVRNVLFIVAVGLFGCALYSASKRHIKWSELCKYMLIGVAVGVLAIAAVALAAATNFDTFWTAFHHQFFSNDLWMLDPSISLMINMLPSELFFALVMRIAIVYFALMGLAILVCAVGIRVLKKREAALDE